MPYLYECHMGGYYEDEESLDLEDLHCEKCGDSDTLVGFFETDEEREALIKGWEKTYDE